MPKWTWSPQWKSYRDMSTGQWASRAQIQEWVTEAVDLADSSTDELSRLIGDVKIDSRTWHTAMREQIKEAYKQQYLLGKGGIEQMTAQDWGSIGGMIADQYRYLDKFAQQIADGKLSEGGPGSGWFAPPKGTHGPGSQGGDPVKTVKRKRRAMYRALSEPARKQAQKGVAECARIGYRKRIEAAVGIKEDGTKMDGTQEGSKDNVWLTPLFLHGDPHVIIHNHPRSTSFSQGDFETMMRAWPPIEHMLLASGDGSMYRLSRTEETLAPNLDTLSNMLGAHTNWIHARYDGYVRQGKMSHDKAWRGATQESAQVMADWLQLDYEYVPPQPIRIGG